MLEQELKNRIANTISQYKLKCDQLEDEITVLKNALYQLSVLPNGIQVGLDKQMHNLQINLKKNKDSKKIKKSVESLVNAMSNLKAKKQLQPTTTSLVDEQINSRLLQLLDHLFIPKSLSPKSKALKANLKKELTSESITHVVDELTDLVIDSFNLEHNQFKGFLNRLSDYLHDFTKYLDLSSDNNLEFKQKTDQLETKLHNNISLIKNHIDEATTVEELSQKVEQNLEEIDQQIRNYRKKEQKRIKEYDEKITILQNKLEEAECGTEAIKNLLSFHKVEINQDSLVELPNRTAYEEYMLGSFHRWQRGFGDLSLAIAYIDHLKDIYNKYGHLAGDQVLKKVADLFKSSVREVDFIARYSSEKFIFIFERTPSYNGNKVLENLRIAIEECEFHDREIKIKITASFGLAALKHGDTPEILFTRADEAMKKARENGGNQVVITE